MDDRTLEVRLSEESIRELRERVIAAVMENEELVVAETERQLEEMYGIPFKLVPPQSKKRIGNVVPIEPLRRKRKRLRNAP